MNRNQLLLTTSSAETNRLTNFTEIQQEVSEMKRSGGQRCVHFMYFIQRASIYFLDVIRTLDPSVNLKHRLLPAKIVCVCLGHMQSSWAESLTRSLIRCLTLNA